MAYKIYEAPRDDNDALIKENLVLKKEIQILETSNTQLSKERDMYKAAYERYSSFFVIKFLKIITGRRA